jgi:hypothetical protein
MASSSFSEYLEAASPMFEELGDDQAACDVHLRLASFLSANTGGAMDVRRAMPHFKKAEAFLAKQPESPRHAMFYFSKLGAAGLENGSARGSRRGSTRWKSASAWAWTSYGPWQRPFHLGFSSILAQ